MNRRMIALSAMGLLMTLPDQADIEVEHEDTLSLATSKSNQGTDRKVIEYTISRAFTGKGMVGTSRHISGNRCPPLQKIKPIECPTDQPQGTLYNFRLPWTQAYPANFILLQLLGKKAIDIVNIMSEQNFLAGGQARPLHFNHSLPILLPDPLGNPGISVDRESGGSIKPG